jgi:hypothetical protein
MQVSESMALLNILFCWLGAYIAVRRPGKRCGASCRIKKSFKHVIGTDRECDGCKKLHGAISTHAYSQKCIHSSMHSTPITRQSSLTNSSPLASCPMWPIFRWGSQYPVLTMLARLRHIAAELLHALPSVPARVVLCYYQSTELHYFALAGDHVP